MFIKRNLIQTYRHLKLFILKLLAFFYVAEKQRKVILSTSCALRKENLHSSLLYSLYTIPSLISIVRYTNKKKFGMQMLIETKKTNTVFILGSGPSINQITRDEWNFIKKNDSWGFNYWFPHEYVPTHYILQASVSSEKNDYAMSVLFKKRLEEYKKRNTIFIGRGAKINEHVFHKTLIGKTIKEEQIDFYYVAEHNFGSNELPAAKLINLLFENKCFDPNINVAVPKQSSTVTFLVSLAIMLGYKEIVLCGIDMKNNEHFFDQDTYHEIYPELQILKNHHKKHGEIHPHLKSKIRGDEYIYALDYLAQSQFNSRMFLANSNSVLYPKLPVFHFNNNE